MVLKNLNIKPIQLIIFLILVVFFSCEKPLPGIINCANCKTDEPITAILEIKVGYNNKGGLVNIYEGNLKDSILYDSFYAAPNKITRTVPLNRKYTLTAIYTIQTYSQYIVVNSVYPRVLYDEESCDNPCYYIYDNVVDMRLKYAK